MKTQSLTGNWQFRQAGTAEWLPAIVPGGVHTDLLALGRIPDPFVADNEKRVQWVAEADWEYRLRFAADPELLTLPVVRLVCDGLDTLATVTLNDQPLGRTDNMFRRHQWDVKPHLIHGTNELVIVFTSPVMCAAEKQATRPLPGVSQAIPGGPHLRKAPCQFGWDWGPQLPPIGIWKEIRLEGMSHARLTDVHLRQNHAGGQVEVSASLSLERWTAETLTAHLHITAPDGREWTAEAAADGNGAT